MLSSDAVRWPTKQNIRPHMETKLASKIFYINPTSSLTKQSILTLFVAICIYYVFFFTDSCCNLVLQIILLTSFSLNYRRSFLSFTSRRWIFGVIFVFLSKDVLRLPKVSLLWPSDRRWSTSPFRFDYRDFSD